MISIYYKNLLVEDEKKLYESFELGLRPMESEIPVQGCTVEQAERVIDALRYDRPDFFFADWNHFLLQTRGTDVKVIPAYFYSKEYAVKLLMQLKETAKRILRGAAGKSEYETALYLHDYLARNCKYVIYETKERDCFNILGALLWRQCVCSGFAHAYKYLCDVADIQCITVSGHAYGIVGPEGSHAWNIILLDGKMSYVDVTFDNLETKNYCSHVYFLRSEKRILMDHTPRKEYALPGPLVDRCPLEVIPSVAQFKKYLRRDFEKGEYTEYLFSSPVESDVFMKEFKESLEVSDIRFLERIDHYGFPGKGKTESIGVYWKNGPQKK